MAAKNYTRGVTIKDNREGEERFLRALRKMQGMSVIAGITAEHGPQEPGGPTVAEYAAYNELGLGVPARPFMGRYFDNELNKINKFAQNAFKQVFNGLASADQAYNAIGLYMQKGIKKSINTASSWAVPNSPLTLERKYKKGAHSFKKNAMMGPIRPKELIDHGIMINSVTFEIRTGIIRR